MLQIRLLGQFDVRLDGKRIVISSRAGQSLLAYLAMTAGTPHRREKLAGTLWPNSSDENARRNLRQELWRIRKAIPNAGLDETNDYLLSDEFTITFNPEADFWLDVAMLERPAADLQSLTSSLSLYQGELLPGFYEDWIVLERERVQTLFEARMDQLVGKLVDEERWSGIQEQCERWLAFGHAPEPAYRALMLAYSARGDMARVSATYQRCVDDLYEQFGVEPSTETHVLYNGLLRGARGTRRVSPVQPSGTVTFLFTDIQGSTRLLEKLGEQYATALAGHHQILRSAIQRWNGKEMDTQGDAFFVTFSRALDAVQCAVEAQRALASHSWPMDEPVRVRMGLHTGEPLIASTGYVGMDVHRAARIGDAAHGGQVLLSQVTRELVVQDLPEEIKIRDLGEHRLKDMKYPTPIYQLVIDGLPSEFPPLKTKFTGMEAPTPGEPPFKGLQYFEETDSDLFFGREVLTAKLVSRLCDSQFLSVIIGASGSGKSSLVRAGLIPALKKGSPLIDGTEPPKGSTDWDVHIITPTAHPLDALSTELTRRSTSLTTTANLIDDLRKDPRSLSLFLARQQSRSHTLLVIDQFEELFTLCREEFEREAFIDNLLHATLNGRDLVTTVITLRADFYAHLAQYPDLRDLVARQQEYIGPMNADELRRAIEEPAKRGHWEFEPGLVDLILRDVGDEPGALPLLSHALLETWKRRAGHTLTLKGYADAGGVHGAIAHTAENIYHSLSSEEQAIARDIFLRLTELGEGTEDTRRRASFEELMSHTENTDEVRTVLNILAEARLVTLGADTAEVAHEALIREWPTLQDWLNQDREGLRLHRHLTEAAREWRLLERDPGALYRGAHLAQAREWAALHPKSLNLEERMFLSTSIKQEQHEQSEREAQQQRELESAQKLAETERARAEEQAHSANRLRMRNRVITTVGSVALILALLAGMFGWQAKQNSVLAQSNFTRAEAQRLAAEANRLLEKNGSPELIALLSLRSMNTQYTPQGDGVLVAASRLAYPEKIFVGSPNTLTVAYSPDGHFFVTGNMDSTAQVWDVKTGKAVRQLSGHTDTVDGVAYSPDGQYVLTGSMDGTARLWDASTGREVRQFVPGKPISSVAYSPDGKYVLTGGADGTARIWDAASGQEVHRFTGSAGEVTSVAFSHTGNDILTGNNDGTIQRWNIQTGQKVLQFTGHASNVTDLLFSADDQFILTGSADQKAKLWDAKTGRELKSFSGHTNNVDSVAFSLDGKNVFTASDDGTARIWDIQTGQELRRFPCNSHVTDVAPSLDGKSILTVSRDGIARIWNIESKAELPSFQNGSGVNGLAFSPDGKLILSGDFKGIARIWSATTGQMLHELSGHTDVINYGVAFSPDGRKAVTSSWDSMVRIWDVTTGQQIGQFTGHTGGINDLVFSPDGKYILSAGMDGARIWDPTTGREVRQLSGVDRLYSAAFSPDGRYIATGRIASENTLQIWDAATGKMVQQFTGMQGNTFSLAYLPDGKQIISTVVNSTARLWDTQTGQVVRQFVGHTDLLNYLSISPDGKYLATSSNDSTARLWDIQTGQELRRFIGHAASVENIIFSPDGKYVLTGSDDGTMLLWDVDYHTTMQYLCSVLQRDLTAAEREQYNITDTTPTCPKQ